MKIPKHLKIGGIVYKVEVTDDWPERGALGIEGDDGYCSVARNTLYIYECLSQEAKEVTLLHEAMHAMNSTVNHEFLDSFAEQLYQVLSDNNLLK